MEDDAGNVQIIPTQYNTEVGEVKWMFVGSLQNKMILLVPITGDENPIDYFFLLFNDGFIQLLVDETYSYAEKVFTYW